MTDKKKPGEYEAPPEPISTELDRRTPITPNYKGAMGAFGSLESFAKRRAARRFEKELDAVKGAVDAADELNRSKEKYARSLSRISDGNLDLIAQEEQDKVDAARREASLRRANAMKAQQQFEVRAEIEDESLAAELAEAKQRRKRAEAALRGGDDGGSDEDKRRRLEREIDEILEDIEALSTEYEKRDQAGTLSDAYEQTFNAKRNRLQDKLARKQAEEEAL